MDLFQLTVTASVLVILVALYASHRRPEHRTAWVISATLIVGLVVGMAVLAQGPCCY